MNGVIFGLDVGTTKICALVGEVREAQLQIVGVGVEPSSGMKLGMVTDVAEASVAIANAVQKAEQTSGYKLRRAMISMAGEHLRSQNSSGSVSIARNKEGVTAADIERALQNALSSNIPQNRQVVHLVPRRFSIDDQPDVVSPIGMFGQRLNVEAHVVTAEYVSLQNLNRCVADIGLGTDEFVLNVLASAEAVLDPAERDMGVVIADIGGGTTDIALYAQGSVLHTEVIPSGGQRVTNDIAIGLRVPFDVAEGIKLRYGDCRPGEIDPENTFTVTPFSGETIVVGRQDLAYVIEARAEQLFEMVLDSVRRSGYTGLLPAGIVLTGGGARLRGLTTVAERVLGVPARVAEPKNLVGLVDKLRGPAYATAIGLLHWGLAGHTSYRPKQQHRREWGRRVGGIFKAFLPLD